MAQALRPQQCWQLDAKGNDPVQGLGTVSLIDLSDVFSRFHRPTDQAVVERSHTLWYQQVIAGGTFSRWSALYEALLKRRDLLNEKLPSTHHAERPILEALPEARHSGRPYRPCDEAALLCGHRLARYLQQGRWFRRVSNHGTVSFQAVIRLKIYF